MVGAVRPPLPLELLRRRIARDVNLPGRRTKFGRGQRTGPVTEMRVWGSPSSILPTSLWSNRHSPMSAASGFAPAMDGLLYGFLQLPTWTAGHSPNTGRH